MATSEASPLNVNAAVDDGKAAVGSKTGAILSAVKDQAKQVSEQSRAYLGQVADQAKQVSEQSKAYLAQVKDTVGTLAQKATEKAGVLQTSTQTQIQGIKENYDKARKAGQTSGTSGEATSTDRSITPGDSGNDAIKFPFNVVTWCTSVCGGKDGHGPTIAGRDFNIESFQASVQGLESNLQSELSAAAQQAQTAAANSQKDLTDKAGAAVDAAASEQQKLVEQAEAAKDAAVAEANTAKQQLETAGAPAPASS